MDITPILEAVIALAAALLSVFAIPWIKNKVGAQNMDQLLAWVEIAVSAAEQLYDAAHGSEKKEYVLKFLEDKGYDVDTEEIDNAIEAAVLHLHNQLYGAGRETGVTADG